MWLKKAFCDYVPSPPNICQSIIRKPRTPRHESEGVTLLKHEIYRMPQHSHAQIRFMIASTTLHRNSTRVYCTSSNTVNRPGANMRITLHGSRIASGFDIPFSGNKPVEKISIMTDLKHVVVRPQNEKSRKIGKD